MTAKKLGGFSKLSEDEQSSITYVYNRIHTTPDEELIRAVKDNTQLLERGQLNPVHDYTVLYITIHEEECIRRGINPDSFVNHLSE